MSNFPIIEKNITTFEAAIKENFNYFIQNLKFKLHEEEVEQQSYNDVVISIEGSPVNIVIGHSFEDNCEDIKPNYSMIQFIPCVLDAIKESKTNFQNIFINQLPPEDGSVQSAVTATKKFLAMTNEKGERKSGEHIFAAKLINSIIKFK